ncbi:MAG: TaqI-like C-terminal specificity domain-containing protein [Pseudomonadota bacterium]|jgi:hypothetical protein|nr:MAG: modification methylase PaeR7I [Pseudomonadota bacterium]
MCPISAALDTLAQSSAADERGAVFTRQEVVEFMLDLAGYTPEKALHKKRLLEPSFGDGDFLLPVAARLLKAWRRARSSGDAVAELSGCIRAVELHLPTFQKTKARLVRLLREGEISPSAAARLADSWLIQGDYLLTRFDSAFDLVVGNPPYVRQELIPDQLLAEYKARYTSIYDRADLYVPFIECSLRLLAPKGKLVFICSDRWMKNRYGGPLRRMIANGYQLEIYVDMTGTPAFHTEVTAYPAITVISRGPQGSTRIARQPEITAAVLTKLAKRLRSRRPGGGVTEVTGVTDGDAPWLLDADEQLALVRSIESRFPKIEEAGCKVGIGVATGADKAFIGPFDELDVEEDRKLPLVMTRDIRSGRVEWRGMGVINPFTDDGGLVQLRDYPRLKKYLEARKQEIAGRHVARQAPANWYRTIDRIFPALARRPKLLIPDIKGEAHVVYERGKLYPHHNLYYILSDSWDLEALQAVLRSDIARLFVSAYSTKMRGGYLRFQAQYLRRIRIPRWDDVSPALRRKLASAARKDDVKACNDAVIALYGLDGRETEVLRRSA